MYYTFQALTISWIGSGNRDNYSMQTMCTYATPNCYNRTFTQTNPIIGIPASFLGSKVEAVILQTWPTLLSNSCLY